MKSFLLIFLSVVFSSLGGAQALAKEKNTSGIVKGINKNTATILTRNSIIALNNANITGNYTTFRDLTAPAFQKQHNAAKLALIFTKIRDQKMNLAPIVLYNPMFTKTPGITKSGLLTLTGFFPTKPIRINFALTYQKVAGQWRIIGISVTPTKAVAQAEKAVKATKIKTKPKTEKKQKEKK